MDGKSKFIAGLVLGAAAGAAVALFLQSEKGKEMMSAVKDAADDLLQKRETVYGRFGKRRNGRGAVSMNIAAR